VWIGTSGFSYPDWKGSFYARSLASRLWLSYYAGQFRAVEINLTFYRPASASTLARWCEVAPEDFAFVFKASKTITHDKKLADCRDDLESFARPLEPVGSRLGCILFQLPPSLKADHDLLASFVDAASDAFEATTLRTRFAMEFRHASWYEPSTLALLQRRGWAVVVHDMARAGGWSIQGDALSAGGRSWQQDEFLEQSAPFLYLRFHGPTGRYKGEYGVERLRPWAALADLARRRSEPVLAFFNNTMAAAAPRDAALFRSLLGDDRPEAEPAGPWTLGSD
jgi:uncharacterized protein YecE (DUF72 family)